MHPTLLKSLVLIAILATGCSTEPSDPGTTRGPGKVFEYPRDLEKDISSIIEVKGSTETSFIRADIKAGAGARLHANYNYDVVIVGGGLAGLTSAVFLSEHGKSVLILEKEPVTGGLAAFGRTDHGSLYSRGAAYWTDANAEQNAIMEHIQMSDYKTKNRIPEPGDAYLYKKQLFIDVWKKETLAKLPPSFALFKFELENSDKDGIIPDQPFEACIEDGACVLDTMTGRAWINKMPQNLRARLADWKKQKHLSSDQQDRMAEGDKLLARFEKDSGQSMQDVIDLLDQYARSALGGTTDQVSAMGLANFYISEIVPRYTTSFGTGAIAERMTKILRDQEAVRIQTSSTVKYIHKISGDLLQTEFEFDGKNQSVQSPYVIFAAQLNQAPFIIEGLNEKAKALAEAIRSLQYANYSVHIVETVGHPYRQAYDTWFGPDKTNSVEFTDMVLGRWLDPKIGAFIGLRNFESEPQDDNGIFTIYDPLPPGNLGKGYSETQVKASAQRSVRQIYRALSGLPKEIFRGPLRVEHIESNRWPYSIHVTRPGHFTKLAPLLRKPFGNIYFANNNIGAPAVEEAIFRGHCAANDILAAQDSNFISETWSNCPH